MRELQAWQGDPRPAPDATADAAATRTESSPEHEVLRDTPSRIAKHLEYCKVVEATEAKYAADQGQPQRSWLLVAETLAEDAVRPTGARGMASGREFDPEAAGGPLRRLDASTAQITNEGVRAVASHLQRFAGDGTLEPPEQGMLDRLTSIADGHMEATYYDQNFYTHELDEAGRYAQLGYGPESGTDLGSSEMYDVWNNVHTASLEDYGVSGGDLFYPGLAP
jgi:hypothetical protein